MYFRMIAAKGVKLASRVMESAALRHDKHDEISLGTTKQTLTMYVSVFVKLVKDANDKKFNDASIFSLLGAFRGVAAVGHILLKDALANVNYAGHSSSNHNLVQEADDTWREFEQEMDILEEKFRAVSKSTKAYQILRPAMTHAMKHTIFFISAMVASHERVLGYVPVLMIVRPWYGFLQVAREGVKSEMMRNPTLQGQVSIPRDWLLKNAFPSF